MITNTDGDDPRLEELLLRWEELYEQGQSVNPLELCSTCPELAVELSHRIALLRQIGPVLADATISPVEERRPSRTREGGSRRESATARALYHDLRYHASGALGEVFLARNVELNREVALKFLQPSRTCDPVSLRRFLQEAEVTGRLEHPGVVPIYALGSDSSGAPCYAMRFIRGETLQNAIDSFHSAEGAGRDRSERSLALRELLTQFVSVCTTVAYAHSRGILHRDLKPRNVMLGRYDETLVVDWGLAKPFAPGEVSSGSDEEALLPSSDSGGSGADTPTVGVVGTLAYMSPEQAEARWELVGPASDIFSLGAILYAILTGRAPYQAGPDGEILEKVKWCEFPKPREVKPEAPRALEAICLEAMAARRNERYATALELAADVKRWLADEPVRAWREPLALRARRWARRHRLAVATVAATLLAGILGLAAVAVVQMRARARLERANNEIKRALAAAEDAQAETQRALLRAEESAQQAKAVSDFLVGAFGSPDPAQDGRQVKVSDILDQANARLGSEFGGSQATRGALLHALGRTYLSLGVFDKAVTLFTTARAVREAALGGDHPDTLASQNNLAIAYRSVGRLHEAIALDESTLKKRERALGSDHPDTLASRNNLGIDYWSAGRWSEAIAQYEATLARLEAALGPDHRNTLLCRNNLAAAYAEDGQPSKAIALHETTLARVEAVLGSDHPDALQSRDNLAIAYQDDGRTREAIALGEATLPRAEAVLGPDHPAALSIRNNLANAYLAAGQTADAITLFGTTLERQQVKLGPYHPTTLASRGNLGLAYVVAERALEAVAVLEPVLERSEAESGPDHPHTLVFRNGLAWAYESLGRLDAAETLYRDNLARRRKTVNPDSPLLAEDLAALGHHLLERSQWSEAEPLFREALTIRAKATPDDWTRYDAMSLLGAALLGQGRYAEAEPPIVNGYEGMKSRDGRIGVPQRSRLLEAAERVISLYEEWERRAQAAAWKTRLGMPDLPASVFAWP
jgi:serine/threonine protein kinase